MADIRRIMLVVAYDGTAYRGSAYQKNNRNTVEEMLNRAILWLTGEETMVIGASRTDAGVHAYGSIYVFDTHSPIPGDRFSFALNNMLPEDIRAVESREVALSFHPRHCNSEKTYEYRVLNTKMEIPTKRHYTYHFDMELNIDAMLEAGSYLVGEHDFTSFCNVKSGAQSHVRTVKSVEVERVGDEVVVTVTGNGFLYNMVRIIVGTLLQIGRGKGEPLDVKKMLEAKDRSAAGPTAPAQGLYLKKYRFPDGIPGPEDNSNNDGSQEV